MRLRTGDVLSIVNIGAGGALVESRRRLLPGVTVVVHLTGATRTLTLDARIARCRDHLHKPGFGESRRWPQVQNSKPDIAILEHFMTRGDIEREAYTGAARAAARFRSHSSPPGAAVRRKERYMGVPRMAFALSIAIGMSVSLDTQVPPAGGISVKAASKQVKAHDGDLAETALAASGRLLASGADDKVVRLWSVPEGTLLSTLTGHKKRITSLAFAPDDRLLAVGSEDKTVSVWSLPDARKVATLTDHPDWVKEVRITPDGGFLLTQAGGELRVWTLPDGKLLKKSPFPGELKQAAIMRDGRTMIAKGPGGLTLWSVPDLQEVAMVENPSAPPSPLNEVRAIALTPDGASVFTAVIDHITRWSLTDRSASRFADEKAVSALAVTPDGKTLVAANVRGQLTVWDLSDGRKSAEMSGHSGPVVAMSISTDGSVLLSGSDDSTARVWKLPEGTPIATLGGHSGSVAHVCLTPDGKTLITGQEPDYQITGPVSGGIGMRKIKADAVIAVWSLDPPAFVRYLAK